MSVYSRDNINYGGMLQNAIANRVANAQREAQYIKDKGTLWGNTVSNVANTVGRAIGGYNGWKGDTSTAAAEDAELEMLKKQLEDYQTQQSEADAYNAQVQQATNAMNDYHPNVVGNYSRASLYDVEDNPYKLPGNSNAKQDEYFQYLMAMNKLYGGR